MRWRRCCSANSSGAPLEFALVGIDCRLVGRGLRDARAKPEGVTARLDSLKVSVGPDPVRERSELGMTTRIEGGQYGLERRVARDQVGSQQILLRVVAVGELTRVVVRQEDIVHADEHSAGELWKGL